MRAWGRPREGAWEPWNLELGDGESREEKMHCRKREDEGGFSAFVEPFRNLHVKHKVLGGLQ